jgi:two-component system response regulator
MPDRGTVTILLADDDEDDRLLTRQALRDARLANDVQTVNDGVELLEYLKRRGRFAQAPRPGLILLDLNMPRMDGREALEQIKQDPDLRSIPVVVLTTSKAEEDVVASYDLGVNSFITKPVTFPGLVDAMRVFSRYWVEIVDLPPAAS